jgi:hypothetical protein
MGLIDRLRLWRTRRRTVRITLGAVPLPTLIPDAERGLQEIYSIHTRKGYRLHVFWELLILSADKERYRVQFFPIAPSPQECLAVASKGRHIIRFMPVVADTKELDAIYKGLGAKRTFELEFRTDLGLMSRDGLRAVGALPGRDG